MSEQTAKPAERLIEQWRFPLGEHVAALTITNGSGMELEPEDIDALLEISHLFKRQIIARQKSKQTHRDYEI